MDPDYDAARAALLEAGAIEECELHGEMVDALDGGAVEEAVTALSSQFGATTAEKLVRAVLADIGIECGYCVKNSES